MSKPSTEELREQATRLWLPYDQATPYDDASGQTKIDIDRVVLALQDAYTAGHNDGMWRPADAEAKPVGDCGDVGHWHHDFMVPRALCVRGLINGLQQYSAGVNWALTEIEKERP